MRVPDGRRAVPRNGPKRLTNGGVPCRYERYGDLADPRAHGLLALGIGLPALLALPATSGGAERSPSAPIGSTACEPFGADNIWNTNVAGLPLHAKSDDWLASMDAGSTLLHPDFGPPGYGIPYTVVTRRTPGRAVRFHYAAESDRRRYPFTKRTKIESGSDRHALMLDRSRCTLYELFSARWNHGRPTAGSGAIFDLDSNDLRPDGWTSADAAGLPILPGLVRFDEVEAGFVGHAIRFTAERTRDRYLWPARHEAGVDDPDAPPMGARFRLSAAFDLSGFGERARTILQAMKDYGLILADNGSNWYFQGTRDRRWTNALLDQLKTVPASAFEAVDVSGCQVGPDSAQSSC